MKSIEKIVIHRSTPVFAINPRNTTYYQPTFDELKRFFWDKLGWRDVYHYVVMPDGRVHPWCPLTKRGCHSLGHNHNSIGVAMLGDFRQKAPQVKQLGTAQELAGLLCLCLGLNQGDVVSHRELNSQRVCPGALVPMDEFRLQVRRWLMAFDEEEMVENLRMAGVEDALDYFFG